MTFELPARDVSAEHNLKAISVSCSANAAMSDIVDLVYASRSNGRLETAASLDALVNRATAANAAHGISGILVVLDGNYLQWLQGPAERVKSLAANIERSDQHTDFLILLQGRQS